MSPKLSRKHSGKDAKVTGLVCPHCKGDHFKVIADIIIGKVPYVYITEETIAVGLSAGTAASNTFLSDGVSDAAAKAGLPHCLRPMGLRERAAVGPGSH